MATSFITRFLALVALTILTTATQTQSHQSGGAEHIVIIDSQHLAPPAVAEVLARLELNASHPDVRHVFNNSAFQGFAASMKSHCLDLLANMSDVSLVEQAVTVAKAAPIEQRTVQPYDSRGSAPWGLQRISTALFTAGNAKELGYTYSFANTALGKGADIYVLDTGIYTEHAVFGGRASMLWSYDANTTDLDGHGTHVSGTAGGATLGVASNANIFGVRTLDGEGGGLSSNVVAGIDFVIQQHDARKASSLSLGSVISMSLASGSTIATINQALTAAIGAGIHACVAAGNAGVDACSASPSSAGGTHGPAITVGSVNIAGQKSSFSNTGECVDVYAPGEEIISSWIGGPNMVNILSGTSMATPHVTGIVAYAMANETLASNPGLMKEWIQMNAVQMQDGTLVANNGVLAGGNPNGLLGFSKVRSDKTWTLAPKQNQNAANAKRGLAGLDGLAADLENAWKKLFGRQAHKKRGLAGLDELASYAEEEWKKMAGGD